MSTQFSWETFYELAGIDPERAAYYRAEHLQLGWMKNQFTGGGWSR